MSFDAIAWAMRLHIPHSPAKFVLVALANNADASMVAFPSIASLCEDTSQDRKSVMANLKRLLDYGAIEDTGERKGQTKQVKIFRLKEPNTGTVEESQERNSTESGTVPLFPSNSTEFPCKGSQISPERVPNPAHGTSHNQSLNQSLNQSSRARGAKPSSADRFDEFWQIYPRKAGGKEVARKSWAKKKLDQQADAIMEAVAKRAAGDPRWADPQFIPYPATYLNQERWTDEWSAAPKGKPAASDSFAEKKYTGTPDDEMPEWMRGAI